MIRQFYKQVLSKLTDVEKIYNTLTWQINVHAYLVTSVPQKSIPSAVVHSMHYCTWYTFLRNRRYIEIEYNRKEDYYRQHLYYTNMNNLGN